MSETAQNGSGDDEVMRYGMLGTDESSTTEKLEKYAGEIGWDYLKKHFEAGSLIYVDPSLELVEVGQAIADDDTARVMSWRDQGDLLQPSEPHADYWESVDQRFRALVVSPFVLAQPLPLGAEAG